MLFVDRNIHYPMYDSLVRVDAKGNIIPWLAEKWTTSTDGKTITFTLRQGVKYHDGSAFDAESVKWNIERYTDDRARRGRATSAPSTSVEVVDATTVKFNLKRRVLAAPRGARRPRRHDGLAEGRRRRWARDFTRKAFKAGTGPFMLTEAVKNDHITLEKNPDWWGKDAEGNKLPFLDKIIVQADPRRRRAPHEPAHRPRAGPEQHRRQGRPGRQGRLDAHVPRGRIVRVGAA